MSRIEQIKAEQKKLADELEARVDVEQLFSILKTEQPFPTAMVEKEHPQACAAFVGIDIGRHDDTEAPVVPHQCVHLFEEQLVSIQIRTSLMPERMSRIGKSAVCRTAGAPVCV